MFSHLEQARHLLPNIRKLFLLQCANLINLPEMPQVKNVAVNHCSSLQRIPCLNLLTKLDIFSFSQPLKLPAEFPALKHLTLTKCHSWSDYSFAHSFSGRVDLRLMPITDLSPFKNVKTLFLHGIGSLTSLQGLEGEEMETLSSVSDQRYICLATLNQMTDFSFCRNIFKLAIVRLPHLTNCSGISNICHLCIKECNNLTSTVGLCKIKWIVVP
jgi:hypothetical protein